MPSNSSLIFNPLKVTTGYSKPFHLEGRSEPNVVYTRPDESYLLGSKIPVVALGNVLPRVLVVAIPSGFCT